MDVKARSANAVTIVQDTTQFVSIACPLYPQSHGPLADELISKVIVDEAYMEAGSTSELCNSATVSILSKDNRSCRSLGGDSPGAGVVVQVLIEGIVEQDIRVANIWKGLTGSSQCLSQCVGDFMKPQTFIITSTNTSAHIKVKDQAGATGLFISTIQEVSWFAWDNLQGTERLWNEHSMTVLLSL